MPGTMIGRIRSYVRNACGGIAPIPVRKYPPNHGTRMDKTEYAPTVALLHEVGLLSTALGRHLREVTPYRLAAEAEDPAGFKRAFALCPPPTAVVLSVERALADDCAMLRWLMEHMPAARNVLCGPEPPVCTLMRLLRAGAHGFYSTRWKVERLSTILDSVCAGALAFPPCLETYLRERLPIPEEHTERALTERERQVLRLIGTPNGPTLLAIARELKISLGRVNNICAKLRKLYKVKGKNGLALLALRLGVVDP